MRTPAHIVVGFVNLRDPRVTHGSRRADQCDPAAADKMAGTVLNAADGGWYVVVLDLGYWKMMKLELEASCGMLSAFVRAGGRYAAGKVALPTASELDAAWASMSTYGLYIVEDATFLFD